MIRSKYLGKEFDNGWKVSAVQIGGRYGKRNKLKGNSYKFILTRKTSDDKCVKSLEINHKTMVRLARGFTSVEAVEKKKTSTNTRFTNMSEYRFLKEGDEE